MTSMCGRCDYALSPQELSMVAGLPPLSKDDDRTILQEARLRNKVPKAFLDAWES